MWEVWVLQAMMKEQAGKQVFVLDIGTRSVVGIAGHMQGDIFIEEAFAAEPHPRRAMIDGQIEDIAQVARVAARVKQRIEDKLQTRLTQVSVAAAGRALKTSNAIYTQDLTPGVPVSVQTAFDIENAAVNEARKTLNTEKNEVSYYCVGHSVVRFLLDDYPFTKIVGHRAAKVQAEVIATFLPTEVVDSLRRCMELLELEIDTLTLEPIAAMRAVIPQDLRLLNLALVDIGAGTSDIAITADNTVLGYTMATIAGDEITEAIIRKLLVSFDTAERLKMQASTGGELAYKDILGNEGKIKTKELIEILTPAVDALAQVVADKIVECNKQPPAAVFLVGGGSKTPGLAALVAEKLNLPKDRVAPAGTNFSDIVESEEADMNDPEFATPLGIALVAADNAEAGGVFVKVNGRKARLFSTQTTSVMDVLLIAGFNYSDIMGRNGRSLTFTLNGERKVVRGTPYTAAEITLNGCLVSLTSPVQNGDEIELKKAGTGVDATATVANFAENEKPTIKLKLNSRDVMAGFVARINGDVASYETPIHEKDDVEIYVIETAEQLCAAAGINPADGLKVNGSDADESHILQDGDVIECAGEAVIEEAKEVHPPTPLPKGDILEVSTSHLSAESDVSGEPKLSQPPGGDIPLIEREIPQEDIPEEIGKLEQIKPAEQSVSNANMPKSTSLQVQLNGKSIVMPPKPGAEPYLLFDMLTLVDIDTQNPKGIVKVLVNGKDAAYTQQLYSGDVVDIGF